MSKASCLPESAAKDLALGIIGKIGTDGGTGYVLEFTGEAIRALSMEGRMTLCNMSIEAGARAGMVAPDETTFAYLKGRALRAAWRGLGQGARATGRQLPTDPGAHYDRIVEIDASSFAPVRDLGHESRHGGSGDRAKCPIRRSPVPTPIAAPPSARSNTWRSRRALRSRPSRSIAFSSDRAPTRASKICAPPPKSSRAITLTREYSAMVVPGLAEDQSSRLKKKDCDEIFSDAGFEWRESGCSMCLA